MVRMQVTKVGLDPRRVPFVLLSDEEGRRVLPIWIGAFEANAIATELQGKTFPRPLTHDLMCSVVTRLGFEIVEVSITRLEESTYYALLHLRCGARTVEIDCRPSDAIAIALRCGAPIFVAEEVLELHEANEEVERFRDLLHGIEPQLGEDELDAPEPDA